MGKRNQILVLLLQSVILASLVSAEHFYIVPNDSISQCQNYSAGICFTLIEFASKSSYFDQDNLRLSFLPGQHLLTRRLTISGPQNIALTGQNSSNSLSTIKCQGTSGFIFGDIQFLNIDNLNFTGCGSVEHGGAIYINKAVNILIRGCHFTDNHVLGDSPRGGVIYALYAVDTNIKNTFFDKNYADGRYSDGGAIHVSKGDINNTNVYYINNSAGKGGAIFVSSGNITSTSDYYINNSAGSEGGAIFVSSGDITSTNDHYINNSAGRGGGAIHVFSGTINSTNDYYIKNSAGHDGGAIHVFSGNINSTNDYYTNNRANYGGAISVYPGNIITSTSDHYTNNNAGRDGGAIYVKSGNVISTNDHYTNNSADRGGAISVYSGSATSTNDHYISNSASYGGAIYGASGGDTELNGASFEQNSAVGGAVIYKNEGALEIGRSNITDNVASSKNTVYLNSGTLSFSESINFMNNHGSLYVFNTEVEFKGIVAFMNNLGDSGGAITAFLSEISFNTASTVTIFNNTATNGGGMSLIQSNLHVYHSIELTDNHATDFGGGIYAYRSDIEFKPEQKQRSDNTKNTASNGGAVCAISSNVHISYTDMDFNSNIAKVNGGAIYLEQNSKIYVQKHEPEDRDILKVMLDFTSNSAEKGGAIFVADNTNDGVICQGANTEIYQAECFLQTLGLYQKDVYVFGYSNYINTFFSNNTAHQSGSDIYGGLLDRCTINQNAELFPEFKNLSGSGLDYVKATTQLEKISDPIQCYSSYPGNFMDCISRSDLKEQISSDAVRVDFCLDSVISPNYSHPNVSIKKGEMFTVSLVAVDQVGNPLNATIINSFQSKSGNGRLKAGQVEQQVGNQCTELEYNVYSQDNSAQIHIHADGPCGDKGVSRKTVNVILKFLPCVCPIGFHPSQSENDCICECDQNSLVFCSYNVLSQNNSYRNVSKKKGKMFTISVVAVDKTGNPVNATIISSFSSESGKGHIKDSEVVQQVGNQCTELKYNVYSLDNSAQININLYTDTLCGKRISIKTLNLNFLPCICPLGFQVSQSENDCICECDQRLKQHQITTCSAENDTILVETNIWIGFGDYTNEKELIIHDCPFDYCVQEPVNISLI